ncbi:hypothetical protein GQ600_7966 [Phytophthora cactorum]|nr:hypothetical protein GQ600_7966 [Phytophthora cactorum]
MTEVDDIPVSSSLFAKLLRQEKETETLANDEVMMSSFDEDHHYSDAPGKSINGHQEKHFVQSEDITHIGQRQAATKRPTKRIDFLAQPRNQTFAEREKQRLVLEMEQLRECTFHPNVLKPPRSISKARNKDQGRPGTTEFQWLTLSPRQKIFRRADDSNEVFKDGSQNVIQRLHLDGTARYDSREQAREALEAQKLQECTFKPKINSTSKSMFSMVDYKPIHHRVSDLQRAKAEYIERIREQLDEEECGPLSFTPMINPKNIGNADGVLKHLRPDRCTESCQQKLYRLTYNDQREAELKKQRLREEQVALRQYFANKRFRSRVALEMEEANEAECTFQPTLVASKHRNGNATTSKLYSREPRSRMKLEWQSENLLHLIEAERQKKSDEIEAKRNAQELKELEECTFKPNLHKSTARGKASAKGSPSPPRNTTAEEQPVIVRGLGRFLELRDRARQQQAEQKQREQKVFAPNTSYEPRSYTVPKPFKLSETSKQSIRRRLKVREEMRAKERQECTFRPRTISSQNRRVLQNLLNN